MAVIPDYSATLSRGQAIANGIQQALNIIGSTGVNVVKQYQNQRSVETAYKGVRGTILEKQKQYGLTDEQAEAMTARMKYRSDEKVEDYEKRIAPTLLNLQIWEKYTSDPNYQVDLPNPFTDTQSFLGLLELEKKTKEQKDIGEAVHESVFGKRGGGLAPGTDISNIEQDIQKPSEFPAPESGVTQAGTQEEATQMIAGRLGGRPVSQEKLEEYPAFRTLPSEAGMARQQQEQQKQQLSQQKTEADISLKEAQTEKAQAQTRQMTTSERVKTMSQSDNKKDEANRIKNLNDVTRLFIAANESLKTIPPDDGKGGVTEEYIDMKQLVEELKQRKSELQKTGGEKEETSMEAKSEATKIEEEVKKMFPAGGQTEAGASGQIELSADKINKLALSIGVKIDFDKIRQSLKQGYSVADIIERILMAKKSQPSTEEQPGSQIEVRGTQIGKTGPPVTQGIGGRIGG